MANPMFTKTYDAGVASIPPYTIVKFSADYTVVPAAAATDVLVGVTTEVTTVNAGDRTDIVHSGAPYVQLGGTVAAGDPLTSDSNGHAVKAAPAAGSNVNCIGRARYSGVSGDVIEVLMPIGGFVLQG